MVAHEFVTNSLGYSVIFILHDWILCLVPYILGVWEIAPNFATNLMVAFLASCHNQMAQRENGKIFF